MAQDSPLLWPLMAVRALSEVALGAAAMWSQAPDGPQATPGPAVFASAHKVLLELAGLRLLAFGDAAQAGTPVVVVAPFALHDASIADFAPGHSLIAALRDAGAGCVHVVEFKSADDATRHFDIDSYLAELNVIVDDLGGRVRLAGLCQGGWMSLAYAARFPAKVERLALAGAPIDPGACDSAMTFAVRNAPPGAFEALAVAGGGKATGAQLLRLWAKGVDIAALGRDALQVEDDAFAGDFARWYARVVDLPGPYYLQSVDWLFRRNRLALGDFPALGRKLDLRAADMPLYLLAGARDEVAPPPQVLAARDLTGARDVTVDVAEACHLGLFMGRRCITENWPKLGRWLLTKGKTRERRAKSS
jgi:poly(3-hydroxyalkanoate) synthetase